MPQSEQPEDDSARNPPSALSVALGYLRAKSRSEADVRAHLRGCGLADGDIDDCICALQGYGYVHDGRLADSVAHAASRRGKGPAWVRQQLEQRLVAPGAAKTALAAAAASASQDALLALSRKAAQLGSLAEPRIRARALRFLLGRGFNYETASGACAALLATQKQKSADE